MQLVFDMILLIASIKIIQIEKKYVFLKNKALKYAVDPKLMDIKEV